VSRPILILDGYVDPGGGTGNLARWLGGRAFASVRVAKGAVPEAPSAYGGCIITGSAASYADGVVWGAEGKQNYDQTQVDAIKTQLSQQLSDVFIAC